MGLLSKLLGGDSELGGIIRDVARAIKQESVNMPDEEHGSSSYSGTEIPGGSKPADPAPFGVSWGPEMPDEPNQFNYSGTYKEYFSEVFSSGFPDYRIESEDKGRNTVYTFWSGSSKALVVELMTEKSSAVKLREECRKNGIPYLRYYYDHDGWWNTREYVTERTGKALRG